ncbi:MAG: DUF883 family protein [Xanthomonadales bacterium]|nr:DUF883 family protein [Xanthomonadales bacterium]
MNIDQNGKVTDAVEDASDRLREAAAHAEDGREEVGQAARRLGRKARVQARMAKRRIAHAAENAREHLAETGEMTRRRLHQGRAQVQEGVRERPFGAMAIAAGVGLALGALLSRRH